jgi:biotin transport system substrate-specific component
MVVYSRDAGAIGAMTALSWCVFPFIIPDLVKLALALVLARRVRPVIK